MTTNFELYDQLRPYLHPGEEVLWAGKSTVTHTSGSIFPTIFAIFFIGFSVFWMAGASMVGGIFFLFGIPFLLVGVGLFYSTTVGRKNALKSSVYAVTETRAILLVTSPRSGTNCKEYVFSNLPSVTLEQVNGSVGTIRFEDVNVYYYEYGRAHRRRASAYDPQRELTTAFVMVEDVHTVYHLISERLGK